MKQNSKNKNNLILIAATALLLAILVTAFFIWKSSQSNQAAITAKPVFSFDATKAPGWWSGGNSSPDPKDFTGDEAMKAELPIASITAFQGTQDKPGKCFVMAFSQKGTIDIDATIQEREKGMIPNGDPTVLKHMGGTPQTFETPEGLKDYVLYQYNLDVPQVQKGNEFGFIQLKNNYIEVRGVCETADLLESTLPGLNALTLRAQ